MNLIVPDVSIIIKWSFKEQEQDIALSILNGWLKGKFEIILPPLWIFEVGNILGMKNPDLAHEVMEVLIDYEFQECKMTKSLCQKIFALMKELSVTFYDAAYHCLAIQENGTFITADKIYFDKAKKKGSIKLLSQWI
ncbi:MAG: hypothetical protein A2042_00640 [Candidatus Schekmanbacteria bacterium GWA2_38_11]|uniref:PIN domain-containing protein n=1 Tax=Candidatus Schekmanbacteria bacterium GWA2_38_11 TaxID=1817876 RepID=A0A1F7RLK0_9BACT|nr:MAG: hypothetical protein A2042_00640 [Candidatus Schekmanbacteria bacterium GWA2_38_11]